MQDWTRFREQMPVTHNRVYFDHAAVGPLPLPANQSILKWAHQSTYLGDSVWPEWLAQTQQLRARAARLLHADQREIALVPNTTTAIGLIAEGFPWRDENQLADKTDKTDAASHRVENIVTPDNEFPSNLYPWQNLRTRGVEVRPVRTGPEGSVSIESLLEACDAGTRLIALSWVGFASGWRISDAELKRLVELAHARGVQVFLDGIQGMGVFPLDVRELGIDYVAGDGHKWMLGPEGAGLLYVRQDRLSELRPLGVGWNSVDNPFDYSGRDFQLKDSAARYEGGSYNMAGLIGLNASLGLLESLGLASDHSSIADRVLELVAYARAGLQDLNPRLAGSSDAANQSGIVAFDFGDRDINLTELRRRCLSEGIVVSVREGRLRLALHAYNTEAEIDFFLQVLRTHIE